MDKLQWTKDFFGSKMEIKWGEELIGTIKWDNMFSTRAQAMINGKLFMLNREFFSSKLEIYDANDQSLLGMVMVNLFSLKSDVVINGKRFELEFKNLCQSKWSWKFNGQEMIEYSADTIFSKDKGEINLFTAVNEDVEILILLGLFVRNQVVLFAMFLLFLVILIIV